MIAGRCCTYFPGKLKGGPVAVVSALHRQSNLLCCMGEPWEYCNIIGIERDDRLPVYPAMPSVLAS